MIEELLDKIHGLYGDYNTDFIKLKAKILARFENLKCCGNCKKSENGGLGFVCTIQYNSEEPNHYCDNWQSDGMTKTERSER